MAGDFAVASQPHPFRIYDPESVGRDGYPPEWHRLSRDVGLGVTSDGVKHLVREQAGHRCERCLHPYTCGKSSAAWSPCDDRCRHGGPVRYRLLGGGQEWTNHDGADETIGAAYDDIEAAWRVLTVHHLNGVKWDLRWWNLAALCQRCHLQIQGKVLMERVWPWEHSEWFRPHAAGWYAASYLGEDLSREQTMARLDELLALELAA